MPQITTIRVVRRRSVQPEQFGNAAAEVELTGNVLDGEDYKAVARQMLVDSRKLVYENLGMKLPASAVKNAEEVDTPQETAKVETTTDETGEKPKDGNKRGPGRPKGSKNTASSKNTKVDADDIPGDDDAPQIRTNPEDRKNPDDDDVPGDDDSGGDDSEAKDEGSEDFTSEDLHKYINDSIKAGNLTVMQAKQMQQEMKVARVRDLDTPAKVKKAKVMIDSFIKQHKGK